MPGTSSILGLFYSSHSLYIHLNLHPWVGHSVLWKSDSLWFSKCFIREEVLKLSNPYFPVRSATPTIFFSFFFFHNENNPTFFDNFINSPDGPPSAHQSFLSISVISKYFLFLENIKQDFLIRPSWSFFHANKSVPFWHSKKQSKCFVFLFHPSPLILSFGFFKCFLCPVP